MYIYASFLSNNKKTKLYYKNYLFNDFIKIIVRKIFLVLFYSFKIEIIKRILTQNRLSSIN